MLTLDKHTRSSDLSLQPALTGRPTPRGPVRAAQPRSNSIAGGGLIARFQPRQRLAAGHFVDLEV